MDGSPLQMVTSHEYLVVEGEIFASGRVFYSIMTGNSPYKVEDSGVSK